VKWSLRQLQTRIIQLRDGVPEEIAAARSFVLLEKAFDQDNCSEEVRSKARSVFDVPCIPADFAESEAQILARLPPEVGVARLGSLFGASEDQLAKAKDLAKVPFGAKDAQRLAARELDVFRGEAKTKRFSAYDRRFFLETGSFAYDFSLALEPDAGDDGAYKRGVDRFLASAVDGEYKRRVWATVNARSSCDQIHAAARWYEQACPVVHLTRPDYTASLASTAVTTEEPVLPWRAVLVELPDKSIPYEGGWVRSILVHRHSTNPDGLVVWNIFLYPSDVSVPVVWSRGQPWSVWTEEDPGSEGGAFDDPTTRSRGDEDLNDFDNRCLRICRRIVVGVCYAMSSPDDCRPTKSADPRARTLNARKGKQPTCRVYLLGRPVKIDCRLAVRQYVEHGAARGKGPLTLQLLVPGHFRRQAVGPGRRERKWIRIEPYWRGPEDAPVRVRMD